MNRSYKKPETEVLKQLNEPQCVFQSRGLLLGGQCLQQLLRFEGFVLICCYDREVVYFFSCFSNVAGEKPDFQNAVCTSFTESFRETSQMSTPFLYCEILCNKITLCN